VIHKVLTLLLFLSFHSKGFIAGVTNQLFEDRTAWWDVLCNIDTGKITVSKDIVAQPVSHSSGHYDDTRPLAIFSGSTAPQTSKYDNGDNEFMADVSISGAIYHVGRNSICKTTP